MRTITIGVVLALIFPGCQPGEKISEIPVAENPAADGFDVAHSDPAAVELADSIMLAMGGRKNWDNTRFISWNFFDRRDITWDKHSGNVRIESNRDSTIYLININTGEGRVQVKGAELTDQDSLKKMLDRAKAIWINDSYWLVMPFKLKDSGVTLKYLGEDSVQDNLYNVLQLTFQNVGVTPQNKYMVYVDIHDKLVRHWSFFNKSDQDSANWTRPWDNYQEYGSILLSADRSDNGGPKRVSVAESMAETVFTSF
jgi:hypothetical protein